jgi:predicted permease
VVRRFFRRGRLDAERVREIDAHLDHAVDDLIANGYPRERALREARRRFGNPTSVREEIYRMNTLPVMETLGRDLRYAFRILRKAPGFTTAAVVTLALGIGANAAVFSAVNALLFEPLPFPKPDRLALLEYHTRSPKNGDNRDIGANGRMWEAVRDHTSTIDAAVVGGTSGVNLVAGDKAAYVWQQRVSAGYFGVMGIAPMIGREFTREEDRAGGAPVVILNYDLWRRVFDGDRSIVGRPIRLRGETYTVIGVMPEAFPITERSSFQGGNTVDVWTPLKPARTGEGSGTNYAVVIRLHDGVSWAEAQSDVHAASPTAFVNVPDDGIAEIGFVAMRDGMTAEVRQPLLLLWGAVAVVLLIACVNVAGLLLARGATRTREIATRMALGSGRGAVVRQLLVESAVLALLGGGLGLVVAWGALAGLGSLGAEVFGLWQPLALNLRVLVVTIGVALGTSVVFGLIPAVQTSRLDVQAALAETGTRGVAGASNRWPRRILVVSEVALGVVLLVSAGLLIRTFIHLRNLAPGFDESNLITASVSMQDARYHDAAAVARMFDDSLARVRAIPGVQDAAAGLGMPYTRLLNDGIRRVDGPIVDKPEQTTCGNVNWITPRFFETFKIPIREGRGIQPGDVAGAPLVTVVNEAFVARYYPDGQAIGRHIVTEGRTLQIVGIVGNTQQGNSGCARGAGPIAQAPCIYVPVTQLPSGFLNVIHVWFEPAWVVRSSLPPAALVPQLRQAIQQIDPELPIAHIRTIDDLRGQKLTAQRFMMWLVAGLGLIALVLAGVGLHGLIASSVSERTRELGIRLALGATARQAIAAVVLPGLLLAGIGVGIGAGAAVAASRLLQSFVWGVTPSDPPTFAGVIAVLLGIALVASLIPAWRVLRLDPALTLRAE